jgi:hypothetical protein
MKRRKLLIFLTLFAWSFTSYAQLSIDVYSGYNHSKSTYDFPNNYNYNYYEAYYTDNVLDTIYGSDTTIIRYEKISNIFEHGITTHSFTPKKILGINVDYTYLRFFKTGVSIEKHGITNSESNLNINRYSYIYSDESMITDSLITFFEEFVGVNYRIYSASLIQSVIFPYKRFTLASNVGIATNFYQLTSTFNSNRYSIKHPLYQTYASSYSRNYENVYCGKSLSFKTSLSISFQLFDNISIFGNAGYSWGNLEFQKGQQMYYYSEFTDPYGGIESVSRSEPVDIAADDIPFGKINYDSWNFRLGLRYTFKKQIS